MILQRVCSGAFFNHDGPTIRYKEIMDYISDDFENNKLQTPFFVTQCEFTEIFCDVAPALKEAIEGCLRTKEDLEQGSKTKVTAWSIVDAVQENATHYATEAEARVSLDLLLQYCNEIRVPSPINELYDFQVVPSAAQNVQEPSPIGRWLVKQGKEGGFFAKPKFETERKRDNLAFGQLASMLIPTYRVDEASSVIGFEYTVNAPYYSISIISTPKYPNLEKIDCIIVLMISRREIRLFWAYEHFEFTDWNGQHRIGELKYNTISALIKDHEGIKKNISTIIAGYSSEMQEYLNRKWSQKDS